MNSLIWLLIDQLGAGKVFSDIYNESARDTGDTTTGHITYVKKKVNDALREICSIMEFSWLKRTATFTPVASTQAYTISSIASDWNADTPSSIWYRGSGNKRTYLNECDDEEWKSIEDINEGTPTDFNISMKSGAWKIYLSLIPDSGFVSAFSTLNFDYFKVPTELSADGDIPEIPTSQHQGLVYFTNSLICVEMGDTEAATNWMVLAERAIGLLKRKQVHRLGRPKRAYPRGCLGVKANIRSHKDYNL